jgi:hypothetical protein
VSLKVWIEVCSDDVLCVLSYEYESMNWAMVGWVLKYDDNETF